jgi:hypothetical protein
MVGQSKHPSELKKIEGDVRITCRRCGFEDDWTPEALSKHLFEIGGSTVWTEITRHLSCRRFGCGSRELRALPVPYARRSANVPRQVGKLDAQLLGTAMTILERAVAHARGQSIATLEVRLALLVVHRYARDREAIRRFWTLASKPSRNVSEDLKAPLRLISKRLEELGWIAPPVLLERTPAWPWQGPVPPGWKATPGRDRSGKPIDPAAQ